MRIIARELGCTAVRVSGSRPERISIAAQAAAAEGLEVWFAPFPPELAANKGGLGWDIVDHDEDGGGRTIGGEYQRDESEQVRYLQELNQVFTEEGLDLAFWFTFAGYRNTVSADPRHDLDLASYGLVSMLADGPGSGYQGLGWRPRLAFEAMARLTAS
jgi:hypothetical protein